MEKNKLRHKCIFNHGKVKGMGFFECLNLRIAGHIDGSRNLPREEGEGFWMSPYLDRELHSYEEFTAHIWDNLQAEEEAAYVRLGELMDSLVHTMSQLNDARADLEAMIHYEETAETFRKFGEDKLTDAQVKARRASESAKRIALPREHISTLQSKLTVETDEFSALCNKILENNNSARMACNCLKDHVLQRIDVYWNSALHKHAENGRMPAAPSVEIVCAAEEIYMKSHKAIMKRAEFLSRTLFGDGGMEEV